MRGSAARAGLARAAADTGTITAAIPGVRSRPSTGPRLIEIVVTPGSGNGRAMGTALRLREALRAHRHEVRLEVFSGLGSLRRWAATVDIRASLLICVGGDATQSAAAAAAVRWSVPFLPVPAGFGNLFARAFGHSKSVDRIVTLLEHGEVVRADVGMRNGELFLCHSSFGLLSEVQERVEASPTQPRARWRRWAAYYGAALHYLRNTPLTPLQVAVDGQVVTQAAAVVTVANVESYGAWLPLTPAASPVDGLFDVFVMMGAAKSQILARLLRRHLRLPGDDRETLLYRGRRVSVAESHSARDELELIPGLLPVVVSADTAKALGALAAG